MTSDRVNVSDGSLSADLIAQQSFGTARRGFDPDEVRAFLGKVGHELLTMHERLANLDNELRDAEHRAAHPTLDEETLLSMVGEETAHILRSAHEAAADIKARAEENASRIVKEAHAQAEVRLSEADMVLAKRTEEAEIVSGRIREAARVDAERLGDQARLQAKAIRTQAEAERLATIEGAQATRDRILKELSRKRNLVVVQVEQLRAGRERLMESYQVVRRTLDEVTAELARAEHEARAAAEAVRPHSLAIDEPDGLDGLDELVEPFGAAGAGSPKRPTGALVPGTPPPMRPSGTASGPGSGQPPPIGVRSQPAGAGQGEVPAPSPAAPVSARPQPNPGSGDKGAASLAASAASSEPAAPPPTAVAGPGPPTRAPAGAGSALPGGSRAGVGAASVGSAPPPPTAPAAGKRRKGAGAGGAGSAKPGPRPEPKQVLNQAAAPAQGVPGAGLAAGTGTGGAGQAPPPTRSEEPSTAAAGPPVKAGTADEANKPSVESLFARIRADRDQAITHAREVLAQPDATDDGVVADADEALLQRRDEMVGTIDAGLTRRLKRALQDDQNDLLDRLRGLRSAHKAELVLPDRADHAARFAAASRPFLGEAVTAGATFVAGLMPEVKVRQEPREPDALVETLANAIVDPLRRRLEAVFSAGEGDDTVALAESVGGAYREWKTQRIGAVGSDHVAAAFAQGAFATVPGATPLRWLVEDTDGPCPDCDDNVLAGALPKGEPFPTGQRHPPAHAGCRCLLVPQRT